MGDLTANFSRAEFRCKCCGRLILDKALPIALQQLRDKLGKPITINCGYRCEKHNREVGGAKRSQHLYGKAADIRVAGMSPVEVARIAETIPAFRDGGIGIYNSFTHVDIRRGKARWDERT